jgi:unspecific monooxygenase
MEQWNSPGVALAWCLYHLVKHPEWADRIRAEVAGRDLLDSTAGAGLPRTETFVKEVLRVAPPVWLMVRDVVADLPVGPHRVAAGQRIAVSPLLLHTDPRWWGRPEAFDPDRWAGPGSPCARYAYLPFGAGSRACLGSQLGFRLLVVATALVATRYRVELSGGPVRRREGPMLTPVGLRGRLRPLAGTGR